MDFQDEKFIGMLRVHGDPLCNQYLQNIFDGVEADFYLLKVTEEIEV